MIGWITLTFVLLTFTSAEEVTIKKENRRSYICPPDFVRLSNKCYYFSNTPATWQDAYWKCSDMHSTMAVLRSPYQDKILRRLLNKKTVASLERWIGGRYDWEQMTWQWAASGKKVDYQGFMKEQPTDKESMRWHCIVLDPKIHYRWEHKSCLERKNFICQTRIKNVTKRGKKKLERQYNVTKYKKLNEIPVPDIPEITDNKIPININASEIVKYNYETNEISNNAYANRPNALRKKKGKGRKGKGKKRNRIKELKKLGIYNDTLQDAPHFKENGNHLWELTNQKENPKPIGNLSWKTYYKATVAPMIPRAIVEEFSYT